LNKKGKLKLKQKLKETLKQHEQEKSALQQEIQDVRTEKAETCNALRTEFGTALDSRDNILSNLRAKLEALESEKLETEQKYESENRELKSRLNENSEKDVKLETKVAMLETSLENVGAELAQVRHEKDNIGDSIRAEFDHICSGLRTDLERVLKERDEIARAMEVR
jgi:septal ring factor EnvC (AmiA/AmiB activator)